MATGPEIPALLKAMSSLPKRSSVASTIAAQSSSRLTSTRWNKACPPALSISATTSLPAASAQSATTTCAPDLANNSAVARPIPAAPPVMMATLPCISDMCIPFWRIDVPGTVKAPAALPGTSSFRSGLPRAGGTGGPCSSSPPPPAGSSQSCRRSRRTEA
ncbi:hypothetical protein D9M72_372690 [compost metagenome]